MSLENDATNVKMMAETNDVYTDHADPSGLLRVANDPNHCKLVWWYDPRSAQFVKSRDPKHFHYMDVGTVIKDYKHWVRGRVFEYQSKYYLIVYYPESKHLTSQQLADIFDHAYHSAGVNIVTAIDDNGNDLSNMLESIESYTVEHSKLGAWRLDEARSIVESSKVLR